MPNPSQESSPEPASLNKHDYYLEPVNYPHLLTPPLSTLAPVETPRRDEPMEIMNTEDDYRQQAHQIETTYVELSVQLDPDEGRRLKEMALDYLRWFVPSTSTVNLPCK